MSGVVYGMPYHADGSVSRECHLAMREVRSLRASAAVDTPVLLWDESFSTREALGSGRRAKHSEAIRTHAAAACIILQEVLQALCSEGLLERPAAFAPKR